MNALPEIVERIRLAAERGTPLRIRGGGSKDFYGNAARGATHETAKVGVLETSALTGITSYEPSELVVTVRAGTPLAELETLLAQSGQCLPFEPPHFSGNATVGGMVASGLSGPARASVGSVRDYVLGLTMINGRGELLTFGGQVMKNVAGYDVSRLMAGAMGTLGLIVEVSLKVLPIAPDEATLTFEMTQAQALQRLNEWGGLPLPLNASRWSDGVLFLRLRGAIAAVEAACNSLRGERQNNADAAIGWSLAREQKATWFDERGDRDLWRLSVAQSAPVLDLPEAPFVEWHGGQRWVRVASGEGAHLRAIAEQAGGHATLFRAARDDDTTPRFAPLTPTLVRIHRALEREFDPAGIFNPGRLYTIL